MPLLNNDSRYYNYFADWSEAKAVRSDFVGDKGMIPSCTTAWCEFCGRPYETRVHKMFWLSKEDGEHDVCVDVCHQCLFILSLKYDIDIQHEKKKFTYSEMNGVIDDTDRP